MLPYTTTQSSLRFKKLLVVIKQAAFEEYNQLKLRGLAPKALRWKRLESRYQAHKSCVNNLLGILRYHKVEFSCVNRAELDRQHLAGVDLLVAVGGDGTVLSAAHFLDHGTIPLLGINSDPITVSDMDTKKKTDERRSHGALCMCTSNSMADGLSKVLYGGAFLSERARIQCTVKSTFSETRLVPILNDLLIANPSPAAVSRFRMGWTESVDIVESAPLRDGRRNVDRAPVQKQYGTVTRFNGKPYDVKNSFHAWSSGMWVSTATGSTAAMAAAGGRPMETSSTQLQYLIREHMIEKIPSGIDLKDMNNGIFEKGEQVHLRWNSQSGKIFIDGSHLTHDLELGDEILINGDAPPLHIFAKTKYSIN
mmetsp:Transcript_18113/g.17485  ORF Transcript_18113/g.17485 Transcript_18113/m.17485 type:complete len:366 (-) Transcript_18113:35-1132(-)